MCASQDVWWLVVNNLFAKLFNSRRHTLVTYVIIHINFMCWGIEKKWGNRKEIMCFGGNRRVVRVLKSV